MSDALISEAEYELLISRAHTDAMFWAEALTALRRSAISTARAFLVAYGEAPEEDNSVFGLLATNAAGDTEVMTGFHAVQAALMNIDLADPASGVTSLKQVQSDWLDLAAKRFAAVPNQDETAKEAPATTSPETTSSDAVLLDLTGVACPMNFVKTKIKLTTMPEGSLLDVILDDGAPIENVPLSLQEQGQSILAKDRISDTQWKIRVEKSSSI